jgi:hypothetical protein
MNYKKLFSIFLLSAALSLSAGAYTVTTVEEKPQWQIDWSYNQERPDWQEPDAGTFENWTVMIVKIEDALLPYVSADDMLAIFINEELRGLSSPTTVVSTGEVDATQYLLKVYGNENYGDKVVCTMKYYNAQLRQVFTLEEAMTLDEEILIGFDEDFIAPFTFGSPKYPVVEVLDIMGILDGAGITPAEGDITAAFVGDECRGVGQWTMVNGQLSMGNDQWTMVDGQWTMVNGQWSMVNVYLRNADESYVLKYYDSAGNRMHTIEASDHLPICDTTGDGVVDVADISKIISIMAEGSDDLKADVNGDGIVDVADIATVTDYMAAHARRLSE